MLGIGLVIVTDKADKMGNAIVVKLGITVTYLNAEGEHSGNQMKVIYVIVSILEESNLQNLINDVDEHAFVSEVKGSCLRR